MLDEYGVERTYNTIIDEFAVYRPTEAASSEFPRHGRKEVPSPNITI